MPGAGPVLEGELHRYGLRGAGMGAPSAKYARCVADHQITNARLSRSQARCVPLHQVACETATKTGMVMVFGEITTNAKVDYEAIVRKTCRDIGFTSEAVGLDADTCKVGKHSACSQRILHLGTPTGRNAAPGRRNATGARCCTVLAACGHHAKPAVHTRR